MFIWRYAPFFKSVCLSFSRETEEVKGKVWSSREVADRL